jgi:coproporphyrinogen III oxidase-like Fe-S oxidoreductase
MIDHIFGLPTDNYDKLLTSYNFYKELRPDVVNCYELLYFPKADINKWGDSKALYQREGGLDFKRYANSFSSLALRNN